jgi:hypothetical protein
MTRNIPIMTIIVLIGPLLMYSPPEPRLNKITINTIYIINDIANRIFLFTVGAMESMDGISLVTLNPD